jgi:hypothetical protein
MRSSHRLLKLLALGAFVCAALISASLRGAQTGDLSKEQHPWGRFPVGSWKSVRVVTETLDDKGQVAGITRSETRTTLITSDDHSYSLRIESTVEVAGKKFTSQPQVVRHGYYGEPAGQSVVVKKIGTKDLQNDGRTVTSDVRQATFESDGVKRTSTIHYVSNMSPYQLRRETVSEAATPDQRSTTLVETVALEMPQKVHGQVRPAAILKTTRNSPQGTKVTVEVHCDDVPGGVVSHSATESDPNSRVVRRSTLELIDYNIGGHALTADPVTRRELKQQRRARRMN